MVPNDPQDRDAHQESHRRSSESWALKRATANRWASARMATANRWASRRFLAARRHPDMVGPVKSPCRLPEGFAQGAGGLTRFVCPDAHTLLSQGCLFLFGSFAVRLSLTPPSRELDEHAAARSLRRWINLIYACLLTHVVIRQGLPHSTSERPAHPKPGSRVGQGFPLTVQMPQPVRPTSWVHSLDNTLKITTLPDGPSLHHRHLPRGSRPHRADNLPPPRPLSLLLEIMPLPL